MQTQSAHNRAAVCQKRQKKKKQPICAAQFVVPGFITSWELKPVKAESWDREQLLGRDSLTSGSQLGHKSRPLLQQHGRRVSVCLGHHHRRTPGAKRDIYPNTLLLPSHPLHIDCILRWERYDVLGSSPLLAAWRWRSDARLNSSALFLSKKQKAISARSRKNTTAIFKGSAAAAAQWSSRCCCKHFTLEFQIRIKYINIDIQRIK